MESQCLRRCCSLLHNVFITRNAYRHYRCFCEGTLLETNHEKSEIISRKGHPPLDVKHSVKNLGSYRNLLWENKVPVSSETIRDKVNAICRRKMSFRAKAINIDIFLNSQLVYQLRYFFCSKTLLSQAQRLVMKAFWGNLKPEIDQNSLFLPPNFGDVGVSHLALKTYAAKLVDLKFIFFNEEEEDLALTNFILSKRNVNDSFLFKTVKFLKKFGIELSSICNNELSIFYDATELTIKRDTTFKSLYHFLVLSNSPKISCVEGYWKRVCVFNAHIIRSCYFWKISGEPQAFAHIKKTSCFA